MELYDMHSHILPAFDDGAKTLEVSLELIDSLRKQGVRNICLTPHFYSNELSYDEYLVKGKKRFSSSSRICRRTLILCWAARCM